jgi:hypothetical protein
VETAVRAVYRPRDAATSPLYFAVLDHLETYLAERSRARSDPSNPCDAKRAVVESGHAFEELLPDVPYRQRVFVLP